MSLNWSISKVKSWESISMKEENGLEGQKTNALVWATISIDLPGITEKNVDEFWRRLEIVERQDGALIQKFVDGQITDLPMTKEDLVRRIGLSTNVSAMGKRAWDAKRKRIMARRS